MTVRYEDEHLLVVDKPAGVVTHPSAGHAGGTLVHGLLAHAIAGGQDPTRPGIVHRLDRDTSGLLVVARPNASTAASSGPCGTGTWTATISRWSTARRPRPSRSTARSAATGGCARASAIDDAEGRAAVTHMRRLEDLGRFTYVDVRLETGRTHQIRVHLESVGHPVVGDRVYGRREETLGLDRQFLHAARMAFPHPRPASGSRSRARFP